MTACYTKWVRNKKFINTFLLYISYLWFATFGSSILPVHFLQQGLDFRQMMLGKVILFASQILLLFILTSFWSKKGWRLATITFFVYILLSIKILNVYQFYFANIWAGFALFFFYVFYNIAHFENTPKEKTGFSSSLMFTLPSLINFIAPLAAGYIVMVNINMLWILAGLFFLISYFTSKLPDNFHITYTIKSALNEIKATRWLIFVEGVWEAILMGLIPIYSLFFIKEPLPYGIYLAYLSLVGIIANLSLGRFTDKVQKRAVFLYPLTIIMVGVTLLFDLATRNLVLWAVVTGALLFTVPLFWNISTALIVDSRPNLKLAIPGREIALAVGRVIGLLAVFVSFTLEQIPHYIFFFLAGAMLCYPLILYWNTRVSRKYTYL